MPSRESNFLSGSSGAGKTTWLSWFINHLRTSDSLFGFKIQRPPFIGYISGDRAAEGSVERLQRGGWESPTYYDLIGDEEATGLIRKLSKTGGHALFLHALESLRQRHLQGAPIPPDSLIVVDGMGPLLGIEPAGHYLRDVAIPMIEANRIARELKLCILLIHHGIKVTAEKRYLKAEDNILGSMALQGFSSTILHLTEPELTTTPGAKVHELTVRAHDLPRITHLFKRDAKTGLFDYAGFRDDTTATFVDGEPYEELLFAAIPEEGISITILAKGLRSIGMSKSTFYRTLNDLVDARLLTWDRESGLVKKTSAS